MSNDIKDLPGMVLTRRDAEMIWGLLPLHVKSGRQRYEHPLFRRLGEIADPAKARRRTPAHRIDEERDAVIVRAFDAGHPVSHIAAEFGVSSQRIRKILERHDRSALKRRIAHAERLPDPVWLTPEWRKGFEAVLKENGVLV
jgi:hypothetical protein